MQKEYKTAHDWVEKVIYRELCKKFKFDHVNKWYMYNLEFVLENEKHKLLWDFEIQTDNLILARQLDLMIVNKKKRTCRIVDFAVSVDHKVKIKESKKRDQYIDLARELKKTMKHEIDGDTNYGWCTWNNHQRINKGTGKLGNKRTRGDYLDYSIIRIGQNNEKTPADLRRLAVTQTPVRNHQLMLV